MIFVNDILLITKEACTLKLSKDELHSKFDTKYMGAVSWFLGIIMDERAEGIFLTQSDYVDKILTIFRVTNAK